MLLPTTSSPHTTRWRLPSTALPVRCGRSPRAAPAANSTAAASRPPSPEEAQTAASSTWRLWGRETSTRGHGRARLDIVQLDDGGPARRRPPAHHRTDRVARDLVNLPRRRADAHHGDGAGQWQPWPALHRTREAVHGGQHPVERGRSGRPHPRSAQSRKARHLARTATTCLTDQVVPALASRWRTAHQHPAPSHGQDTLPDGEAERGARQSERLAGADADHSSRRRAASPRLCLLREVGIMSTTTAAAVLRGRRPPPPQGGQSGVGAVVAGEPRKG